MWTGLFVTHSDTFHSSCAGLSWKILPWGPVESFFWIPCFQKWAKLSTIFNCSWCFFCLLAHLLVLVLLLLCLRWWNILVLLPSLAITAFVSNLHLTQVCFMSDLLQSNPFQIIEQEPRLATNSFASFRHAYGLPTASKCIVHVVMSAPYRYYRDMTNSYRGEFFRQYIIDNISPIHSK